MTQAKVDVLAVMEFLRNVAGQEYAEAHAKTVLQELTEDGYSVVSRHASLCGRAVFFGADLKEADGKLLLSAAKGLVSAFGSGCWFEQRISLSWDSTPVESARAAIACVRTTEPDHADDGCLDCLRKERGLAVAGAA